MVMVLGIEEHVVENGWSPIGAPLNVQRDEHQQQQQHWNNNNINNNFDSSNAVSFGFVATAILISMFLLMAIFERFLAPSSQALFPNRRRNRRDVESPITKPGHSSPKKSVFTSWVSVLMPGEEIPTFIAHPAPVPCCPERISWPSHQHTTLHSSTSNVLPNNINHV
ncbi:uncharacterized protein LOC123911351 isoform X1 [Trifolium pratense]|uniref:uncharacterized protein LOC123911351 isoform X1 n=1 Tax=Trifolium pratense TaxID=57577 RepID=UPI001E690ABD|nr:uncharacterized protein LOC123911351 isoform X1 [Trifolium pratense]